MRHRLDLAVPASIVGFDFCGVESGAPGMSAYFFRGFLALGEIMEDRRVTLTPFITRAPLCFLLQPHIKDRTTHERIMSTFSDLPDEVMMVIFEAVSGPGAMYNLCLVSRRFSALGRACLFRDMDNCKCLDQLASNLIQKPHLIDNIHKVVYLVDSAVTSPAWHREFIGARQEFLEMYASQSRLAQLWPRGPMTGQGSVGSLETFHFRFLEFALSKFTGLKHLSLVVDSVSEAEPSFWQSFANIYAGEIVLPGLESLAIEYWDSEYGFDLGSILPVIAMISVRSLRLAACITIRVPDSLRNLTIPSTTELVLLECALTAEEMDAIVRLFPKLETFWYSVGPSTVYQDEDLLVSTRQLTVALQPLGQSLRTLMIDQSESLGCEHLFDEDESSPLTIGSLHEFDKLKD